MTKKEFYQSKAWRELSRAFLISKNYVCERCGNPAEIAHHKTYLTAQNVNRPEIALNPDNLQALCLTCHNNEHFSNGGAIAANLEFDHNGDIHPVKTGK